MAQLFSQRKLAESFLNRNVIIHSEGHRNRLNELRFGVEFDFGKHGKWSNRIDLPVTLDAMALSKKLGAYQDDIYEQIGALEEIERWASGSNHEVFSHVLCQEKPLFFHGFIRKETLVVQVFGEGLYDFEIRWDLNRSGEFSSFTRKLDELRETFQKHLRAIEQISMVDLMKKEAA